MKNTMPLLWPISEQSEAVCHVTVDRAVPVFHPAITSSALAMNSFVLAVLK
jgi:hypothetical protein